MQNLCVVARSKWLRDRIVEAVASEHARTRRAMIRVGAGLLALVAASTRDAGAADIAEGKAAFVRHRACRTPATSSTSAPDRTRRIRHLRKSTRCRRSEERRVGKEG